MNGYVLLAAGLGDFLIPLMIILFVVISLVGQAFNKLREAKQGQGRGPVRRPGGPRPNAPPAPDPLRGEVDDFLRGGRPGGARPAPPPRPVMRPPGPPGQRPPEEPAQIEILDDDATVADHVRRRLTGEKLGRLSSDVGERLAHVDDTVEDRLHDVFDHGIGALGKTPGESARTTQAEEAETPEDRITSVPATAAAGLAAMLANPGNLRQAIVLSEILQRPEHRW